MDVGRRELAADPRADGQARGHTQRDGHAQASGRAPERARRGRLDGGGHTDGRERESAATRSRRRCRRTRTASPAGRSARPRRTVAASSSTPIGSARSRAGSRYAASIQADRAEVARPTDGGERELLDQRNLPRERLQRPDRADVDGRPRRARRRLDADGAGAFLRTRRRRRPVGDRGARLGPGQRLALAGAHRQRREPHDLSDLLAPELVEPARQRNAPDHEPVRTLVPEREPRLGARPEDRSRRAARFRPAARDGTPPPDRTGPGTSTRSPSSGPRADRRSRRAAPGRRARP